MNTGNWYPHWNGDRQPRLSPDIPVSRVAADSVQDAHKLLAIYPFVSATPSTHVARHLSSLTITANPPSYIDPHQYTTHGSSCPPGTCPPYPEYANELNHLALPQPPVNDGGYWRDTRNDALRFLGEQSTSAHTQYPSTNWIHSPAQGSGYQTNAFAQSIFQHTAPSASYPTPPPPGISSSSSSLAFALGEPKPPPSRPVYRAEDSDQFFNGFLAQTSQRMQSAQAQPNPYVSTPNRYNNPQPSQAQESPDPLALGPSQFLSPSSITVTPRKRKSAEPLLSPSIKRMQAPDTPSISSPPPLTPSTVATPTKASTTTATKRKLIPYVEIVTPKSFSKSSYKLFPTQLSTPTARHPVKMKLDDDDDLGGFTSEGESPRRASTTSICGSVRSSSRKTGDRDERVPLEKLTALLEDIFEAEDSLPPDASIHDLSPEFFSPLSADCNRPSLHPNMIRKLTKYIGKVARPAKRLRISVRDGLGATPRGKGGVASIDTTALSRILKILERSVKAGEDLEPFGDTSRAPDTNATPRKSQGAKKASKTSKKGDTPNQRFLKTHSPEVEANIHGEQVDAMLVDEDPKQLDFADVQVLTGVLETARDSVLSADCCLALLGSDRLTKQLYSEELITVCLNTIKSQLAKIAYPFVEASSDGGANPLLRHLLDIHSPLSREQRSLLGDTFQALSAALPRINNLVCADVVSMSESIIIQAVYIAIGPFFVTEPVNTEGKGKKENVILSTLGNSSMRGLRLDALSLIRSIFANYEDQRSWIVEEILSSLIKLSDTKQKAGQFRLRDGRSIRTVSALLLQLVQTSAHDIRLQARKVAKARQESVALRRQESLGEVGSEPLLDDQDQEEIRLYSSGLDSASKVAKTIVLFLTQRSGKTKATKNTNEAEYRTIFDNLISDLLTVLFWPEWPAASLLLGVICKFMVTSLDDIKTSQADNNAAKNMALDHLGIVAARLKTATLKFKAKPDDISEPLKTVLRPLDEILPTADAKELNKILAAYRDVVSHLCKRSSEDQAYDSARELTAAAWGQELAQGLKQANTWISDSDQGGVDLNVDRQQMVSFAMMIKAALRDIWKDPATDVFDIGSEEEASRVDRLSEEIGTIQSLRNSFHPILNKILLSLEAPPVFMRTKALRALGQIITSDPTILSSDNVRKAIESHLRDNSPAVRDAAVELIGKYMIDSSAVADNYYGKIADRIADLGLGVRKRVIKLLKSFYSATDDLSRRVDICTKIVCRMADDDDSVKDLALKTMEELWFQSNSASLPSKSRGFQLSNPHDKTVLLSKVAVIMGVSAHFRDRSSLEDMLHKIMADKDGNDAQPLHELYAEICEALIDGLVDASDLPGFTIVNCVRTIYLFTSAHPAILTGTNALTLLPYLKNATTAEEQITSDYLLKIFRASVPHMPKSAAKFGQELQLALQPMVLKPSSSGGVQTLQETVACLCVVVQNLTRDFQRLINLLKSCNTRIQKSLRDPVTQGITAADARALGILVFIVSLVCEHCDFDQLRIENEEYANHLNAITSGPIIEHVYDSLLKLYGRAADANLRGRILPCLGFLFRAQPTLMTLDRSASVMDAIFASHDEELRGRLLKIIQDFLTSEALKHNSKEKVHAKSNGKKVEVDMDELVGNTDGFADSGVSSAVVQRYMDPILEAALSLTPQTQASAVDILSFTVKQGLAHPLQSFPVIVALETSPNAHLGARANALHQLLHTKHSSLLNSRYGISAKTSFDYQRKLCSGIVKGYRMQKEPSPGPAALLQRWYSLVREKRAPRLDFLKALLRIFDVPATFSSTTDDVDFTRYMAENFSAFDYKTQEEVLTVLKQLTNVLSTSGAQLVELLEPGYLFTQLHGPSHSGPSVPLELSPYIVEPTGQASHDISAAQTVESRSPALRSSVIIGVIMLLKAYLKTLYAISEEKLSKWAPGKKTALGDKPATKRHQKPIAWDRLTYAVSPLVTSEDLDAQKHALLAIWSEDGTTPDPEEEGS